MIGWDIFYFSATAEQNYMKQDRKLDLNILFLVEFVFLGRSEKQDGALTFDWSRHFQLQKVRGVTGEQNVTLFVVENDLLFPVSNGD